MNYDLASLLVRVGRRDDAIRFYTAARALRPGRNAPGFLAALAVG